MRAVTAIAATVIAACLALPALPASAAETSAVDIVPVGLPLAPPPEPPAALMSPGPQAGTTALPSPEPGAQVQPAVPGAATPFPVTPPASPSDVLPLPTSSPPASVGYDVSWPQCYATLPTGQAFGIVGVNGGLANNTNPCLAAQLSWAAASTGVTSQPRVALYVNTANPPVAQASWWPSSNSYPPGALVPVANPYGQCVGAEGAACSYVYGYAKAYDNATIRGVPNPASFFWWLDVETENSWTSDTTANRAALEGMVHYYVDVLGVAGVGIYSTGQQWTEIVGGIGAVYSGTVAPGPSNLNGLPSWLAGATTLAGAQAHCSDPALTGGTVTLAQYLRDNLDFNHACS